MTPRSTPTAADGLPGPAAAGDGLDVITARALHMMGPAVAERWTCDQATAWEGLIEVTRRLRRRAEELLAEDDLGISMLGILGRLTRADDRTLRQTALADAMGLSLSRVSRVVDILERRELVERRTCPSDARATNVVLTPAGAELAVRAQGRLFAFVQEAFMDRLGPDDAAALAGMMRRLLVDAPLAGDCGG